MLNYLIYAKNLATFYSFEYWIQVYNFCPKKHF